MQANMSTHSEAEHTEFQEVFLYGPFVNVFMCAIAAGTSLAFQKQRVCPTNLIIWISLLGLLNNIVSLARHQPDSAFYKFMQNPANNGCRASLTFDTFFAMGTVVLNTLLAFSIWNMVHKKRRMDHEHTPLYGWLFPGIFVIIPTICALVFSWSVPVAEEGVCVPTSHYTSILYVPWACGVLLQIFFLSSTLYEIQTVSSHIAPNLTVEQVRCRKKDRFMFFRFLSIIVLQIVMWLFLWVYYYTVVLHYNFTFLVVHAYLNQIGYFCESLVIMASNKCLREWLEKILNHSANKMSPSSSHDIERPPPRKAPSFSVSVELDPGEL